jgi:hypothetical protein
VNPRLLGKRISLGTIGFVAVASISVLLVMCFNGALRQSNAARATRPPRLGAQESGQCGPPHYCARTDRKLEPYPKQAPIVEAAGSVIIDPSFGSRILRVTDGKTPRGFPGWSSHTSSSSEQNTWNVNSRRFYVEGEGGHFFVFDLDPDKLVANYSGLDLVMPPVSMQTDAEFSFSNPDVIYGWQVLTTPKFMAYDFSTKKAMVLHDPASCVDMQPRWRGLDISVSADDQRLMGVLGPQQDNDPFVYIFDRKRGCRWYNTSTGEVGGKWGPKGEITLAQHFLVHNARISKSGQYVVISGAGPQRVIWQVDTLEAAVCTHDRPDYCGGHVALGYSHLINPLGLSDSMNLAIRSLDNVGSTSPLIRDIPQPVVWPLDKHLSWNNVNPSDTTPVCLSTYRDDNPGGLGAPMRVERAWDNEILCVAVDDEKHEVWRFAHTFSTAKNGFWSTPRGNVSQDGHFFMFTSDWEDALGAGRNGGYRTDAFIVELK